MAAFLLITESQDNYWRKILDDALTPMGKLQVVSKRDAFTEIVNEYYDIVIIDATVVGDVEVLVSSLRSSQLGSRIVVMTASPTWQRARAAFEAGAVDYIPKTFSKAELHDTFNRILRKSLPPQLRR